MSTCLPVRVASTELARLAGERGSRLLQSYEQRSSSSPTSDVSAHATGVEIAQLLAGEAAAVVHAARTWAAADMAAAPAGNITRVPMLRELLPDRRARFADGSLSPRLDAVRLRSVSSRTKACVQAGVLHPLMLDSKPRWVT